ncbi:MULTISPECIES: alpha/beta hydrolase fold domain-containing protein [unclassified Nonomuraea]|uniref:alpha/beta hydrolase fold domain-containing protein n=1 Tax=unclassified Nonomuraea TaxID=2593643 RepID=UPI0033E9689C
MSIRAGKVEGPLGEVLRVMMASEPLGQVRSVAEQREEITQLWQASLEFVVRPAPEGVATEDLEIPVNGGTIGARIYRCEGAVGTHVFFHGGAYWLGSVELSDVHSRWLAKLSGVAIVSVDYRLAPEHPYPTPIDDCVEATAWLAANSAELGLDSSSLSIGGESAGANAAAVVALRCAAGDGPELVAQVLSVPLTDWLDDAIYEAEMDPRCTPTAADMALARRHLFGGAPQSEQLLAASPLRAAIPDGMRGIKTMIMTNQFDRLRDSGQAYAQQLLREGVEVTTFHAPDIFHGGSGMTALSASARRYEAVYAAYVRETHVKRDLLCG